MDMQLPKIHYRPNTDDFRMITEVMAENEYRLPSAFDPNDIVIDLGAHIGTFAMACALRGARRILCFEPDSDNFAILKKNFESFREAAMAWGQLRHGGVVGAAKGNYHFFRGKLTETARAFVAPKPVPGVTTEIGCLGIADVLDEVSKIRLLKSDVEGEEWAIVENQSARWDKVQEFIGEVHFFEDWQNLDQFTDRLKQLGFDDVSFSEDQGYPQRNFFARRKS